jgi:6-phosphogluconolactonase
MKISTHVFENIDALYDALDVQWRDVSQDAIARRGMFNVALSGGSTPRSFYSKLAGQTSIKRESWQKTCLYFGDERCVPQDHPDSNYRMAREALISSAPIMPEHVHAMFSADLSVDENVSRYNAVLTTELPLNSQSVPVFDLILLGMGEDGHTASLFPGTQIVTETESLVAAQFVEKLDAWRMSLTFPTINAAHHVAVLVAGEAKAKIVADILSQPASAEPVYPIQRVKPTGQLDWYLDAAAAQFLQSNKR